jgi:4-alpha-glucanotransferase
MITRGSGILMHLTSLPSRFGIGDMGPEAYNFADFLVETNQDFWQILPLNLITPDHYSPYTSPSAFACNTLLISPELLVRDDLLSESDLGSPDFQQDVVDYRTVQSYKEGLLRKAFFAFREKRDQDYDRFLEGNKSWLEDFALFRALKSHFGVRRQRKWGSRWDFLVRSGDVEIGPLMILTCLSAPDSWLGPGGERS